MGLPVTPDRGLRNFGKALMDGFRLKNLQDRAVDERIEHYVRRVVESAKTAGK